MNEEDNSLKKKAAEIEALLNAYTSAHTNPPPLPKEPAPEIQETPVFEEPILPAPEPETAETPVYEEAPLEADELTELVTETVEEEKDAEISEILAETEEPDSDPETPGIDPPYDEEDALSEEEAEEAWEEEEEEETADYSEYDDEEPEEALSEEEETAEEERRLSRFTRGCLEVAIFFAALAVALLLLEQIGICIGYELPQLFLPLTMAAGSLLALTICLYSALRKALASFVMIVTIWFLIMLYAITNFQFPEVIPTKLPETNKAVTLTQITTPINANLCVDEILIPGMVSRRFKLPVHPKYMPLGYQVQLIYNEETQCNELYYNDLLWAVYNPAKNRWTNATRIGSMMPETTTEPPETAPLTRKPHRTGRSGTSKKSTTTTTTTTTAKKQD